MQQNQSKNENRLAFGGPLRKGQTVLKNAAYEEFILWSAMPAHEQKLFGIETQKEFAERYKCGERSLTRWRSLPEFQARVRDIREKWAFGRTSNVINAIYTAAIKGNPLSQSLWMQVFEGYNPKGNKDAKETEKKVEFSINDMRFLIEQLPEQLKQKHYGYLAELLDDVDAIKHARDVEIEIEERDSTDGRSEEGVCDYTYTDAQTVPDKETDAVSSGNKGGVRENLVWKIPTHHHQSAERWREEQATWDSRV